MSARTERKPGESDEQRKLRQRREVAAYEKREGLVPGTAGHRGDGLSGGPSGGTPWADKARMAAARFAAYGSGGLNDTDLEALRLHPEALGGDEEAERLRRALAAAEAPAPAPMPTARSERDAALSRVEANTDEEWKRQARAAVERLARSTPEFISDAVWDTGLEKPHEPRALGPIMRWAQAQGLIAPTDRLETSAQVASHAMPRRVWRSLVYAP